MNRLNGTVASLETEGDISLVEVEVPGGRLFSLVLESEATSGYLAPGSKVTAQFKESEVALAPGAAPLLSIRNRLPCVIRSIREGRLLTHLILEFGRSELHSLISTRALHELGLRAGSDVTALIKATEVGLAEGHVQS